MKHPTIIPRDPSLVPVAKNGKFLGYASRSQIDAHGLELWTEGEPAPKAPSEPVKSPESESEGGAKPDAVRKGPAKPKADA